MTSRKERRQRQLQRELQGLPQAKPWTYAKEDRVRSVRRLIEKQDRELSKQLGVSLEVVTNIRKALVTTALPTV